MDIWFIVGLLAEKFCQTEMEWCEMIWTPLISNWPLVAVAVWGIVVAINTLKTLTEQTKATKIAAEATKASADALIESERAWIIASPIEKSPQLGYVVFPGTPEESDYGKDTINVFGVAIKNTGETPARLVEEAVCYKHVESLQDIPEQPIYGDCISCNKLLLVTQDSVATISRLQPNPLLRKTQAVAIRRGKEFLYAYGFIRYLDVFGRIHETGFGYLYLFPLGGDPRPLGFTRDGLPPAYNYAS